MKHLLEKISILSLSFMLVSTYAVSPAIPEMIFFFRSQGYAGQEVEFLITVTSLAIMVALLLNPLLTKWLSERTIVTSGLILVALGGALPLLTVSYPLIFLGRLVLGFGLGMINARAINTISAHYQGLEKIRMLGLRGSSEVLGSAALTALVGILLPFGWQLAFAIYLLALLILVLYRRFVPEIEQVNDSVVTKSLDKSGFSGQLLISSLFLAFVAAFVINVNTALTLKIPVMIQEGGLGSSAQSSLVLSIMMLMGIVSGICFSHLLAKLKNFLLPLALFIFSMCIFLASIAQDIVSLSVGAILSGFSYSIVLTRVFHKASEETPSFLLNQVTTLVLVGCNLGGASSAFIPDLLAKLNRTASGAFGVYALIGLLLSLGLALVSRTHQTAKAH